MAITTKSRAEIISDIVNTIKGRDRAIETGYGPVKDIVVDPVSLVGHDLYVQVQHVFDVQFLKNAQSMSLDELDLLGESLGIVRKGPVRAVGTVFFATSSQPTQDITIPAGFPVATSTRAGAKSVQSFVTTANVTLFAVSAKAFFNPAVGLFEIEVPIKALIPGDAGRVASGSITSLQRQIPGLSAVYNKSATSAGKDAESNIEYARRIQLALLGTDRGTINGLRRFALADQRVVDALVVMAGDPLMTRDEDVAGAVDVYILGDELTISTQQEAYDGLDITFDHEPLLFSTPTVSVVGSVVGVLVEGTHFFIVKDPVLGDSAKSRDTLRWNRAATGLPALPTANAGGEMISLQYTFDKLIADLQSRLEVPDNDVLANVLFRRAVQVDITLSATIKVSPDTTISVLSDKIRSAIRGFVNTLGLGENVVPSDLDLVIRSIPGVDFVFLPFDVLDKIGGTGSNIVPIEKNQYAQISDTNITLKLST